MLEPTRHQEDEISRLADEFQAVKVCKRDGQHLIVEVGHFEDEETFIAIGEYKIPSARGPASAAYFARGAP